MIKSFIQKSRELLSTTLATIVKKTENYGNFEIYESPLQKVIKKFSPRWSSPLNGQRVRKCWKIFFNFVALARPLKGNILFCQFFNYIPSLYHPSYRLLKFCRHHLTSNICNPSVVISHLLSFICQSSVIMLSLCYHQQSVLHHTWSFNF